MPRFSVCMPALFPDALLEEALPRVKALGYEAWETWWLEPGSMPKVRALNEQLGLRLVTFSGHGSLADGLNRVENHARILRELEDSLAIARSLGCSGLICFAGNSIEDMSDQRQIEAAAACLKAAAPMAEDASIDLNVELLNTAVDHPGYFCNSTDIGAEIVRRAGSPRVKLLYDIYHMQIMEGNLIATITGNLPHIGHFHAAGVPGRHDLDDHQEINYRAVFRAIEETGYEGFVGLEYWPKAGVMESLGKLMAAYG